MSGPQGWGGHGVLVAAVAALFVWILLRFLRGRRQLRENLATIEVALQRMQREIERDTPEAVKNKDE